MRRSERMAVSVSIVCLGLLFLSRYSLPTWSVPLSMTGFDRSLDVSGNNLIKGLLVLNVCLGIHATIPADPRHSRYPFFHAISYWPVPALLTLASVALIPQIDRWAYQVAAIGLTGASLTFVAYVQVVAHESQTRSRFFAQMALAVLAYGAVWTATRSILMSQWPLPATFLSIALTSGGLALSLLRDTRARLRHIWTYAGVIAVIMGELGLCHILIRTDARLSGLVMLVCYYCLVGLSRQRLEARLDRRAVAEFSVVAAVGLVVPWLLAR